jgi:hypothetical protein
LLPQSRLIVDDGEDSIESRPLTMVAKYQSEPLHEP